MDLPRPILIYVLEVFLFRRKQLTDQKDVLREMLRRFPGVCTHRVCYIAASASYLKWTSENNLLVRINKFAEFFFRKCKLTHKIVFILQKKAQKSENFHSFENNIDFEK